MRSLQFLEKGNARGEGGIDIGGVHGFRGVMTDAAGRA
jgi:hypothetical protein